MNTLGLELSSLATAPALAAAAAAFLLSCKKRHSRDAAVENLVWLTLVVAVSAAAMLALALLPTFDPGIAFAAAGACLAFSVLRL